jgi:hypothetical protein
MKPSTNPIVFLAAALGVGLVFSAVRNVSPVEFFRLTIQGGDASEASNIADPVSLPNVAEAPEAAGRFDPFPAAASDSGNAGNFPVDPTDMVSIGQGSHRLIPAAAAAFQSWERAYGARIFVTDSYRTAALQAARHEAEPNRFVKVGLHPRGIAVDVDLGRTTNGQSVRGETQYDKLSNAARIVGFVNYSNGAQGTSTHHFSFGARG